MRISGAVNKRGKMYITSETSEDTLPKIGTVMMHLTPASSFMFDPEEYPEYWKFNYEGSADWFDEKEAERKMREQAGKWYKDHVFINKSIDEIQDGFYYLIGCRVGRIVGNAIVVLDRSDVNVLGGSAYAYEARNSRINNFCCHAVIGEASGRTKIKSMYGNAVLHDLIDKVQIDLMGDNACIIMMSDHSRAVHVEDNARILASTTMKPISNIAIA